jgi:signal transduction histidine kinase
VCVAAHRDDGRLVLQVSDTGVGLGSDAAACLTRGVGLSNISQRLARLYGGDQRLAIANRDGGGAEVTLSLPYRSDP